MGIREGKDQFIIPAIPVAAEKRVSDIYIIYIRTSGAVA
jgi:hypothetical protein